MSKIVEKILEPSRIEVGYNFKLKIKAIRYISYEELKIQTVSKIKKYKVAEMKGE